MKNSKILETIDLNELLAHQEELLVELRRENNESKQKFIEEFQRYRNETERKFYKLEEFYIRELTRVFDFRNVEEINQHIDEMMINSQLEKDNMNELRNEFELEFEKTQNERYQINDLQQEVAELKAQLLEKDNIITELEIQKGGKYERSNSTITSMLCNENSSLEECSTSMTSLYSSEEYSSTASTNEAIAESRERLDVKEFKRENYAPYHREEEVTHNTVLVGDEVDYEQIKVDVIENLDDYKLTRNPVVTDNEETAFNSREIIQEYNKFKEEHEKQQDDNEYYLSLVMPWIADVESSKEELIKEHAALLDEYEKLESQNNRLLAQTIQEDSQTILKANEFENQINELELHINEEDEKIVVSNLEIEMEEEELEEMEEEKTRIEKEYYHEESQKLDSEKEIERMQEEIEELTQQNEQEENKINGIFAKTNLSPEDKKYKNEEELINIYKEQITSLCERNQRLEEQNDNMACKIGEMKLRYEDELLKSQNEETINNYRERIEFLEKELNGLSEELANEVNAEYAINKELQILENENSGEAQTIVELNAETNVEKRKLLELSTNFNKLVCDLDEKEILTRKIVNDVEQEMYSKDKEIEQLNREISRRELDKNQFPPQIPKSPEIEVSKDNMNRILTSEINILPTEEEKEEDEINNLSEILEETMDSKIKLSGSASFINIINAFNYSGEASIAADYIVVNKVVQTDEMTAKPVIESSGTEVEILEQDKGIEASIIDISNPEVEEYLSEINFLKEQVGIYENASIMLEQKNKLYVQSYEDYEEKIRIRNECALMEYEDLCVAKRSCKQLSAKLKSYPTIEELKATAEIEFRLQVHEQKKEIEEEEILNTQLEESLRECESINEQEHDQFLSIIESFANDVKTLEWIKQQLYLKLDKCIGRTEYAIARADSIVETASEYVQKNNLLMRTIEILADKDDHEQSKKIIQKLNSFKVEQKTIAISNILASILPNKKSMSFSELLANEIIAAKREESFRKPVQERSKRRCNTIIDSSLNNESDESEIWDINKVTIAESMSIIERETACQTNIVICEDRDEETDVSINIIVESSQEYCELKMENEKLELLYEQSQNEESELTTLLESVEEATKRQLEVCNKRIKECPSREEDSVTIQEEKILISKLERQNEDYKKKYDALAFSFRKTDGMLGIMIGGRATSAEMVHRNKWNIGYTTNGQLKNYV